MELAVSTTTHPAATETALRHVPRAVRAVEERPSHVGVGLYSIASVARISSAHPETVRRWLNEESGIVPRQLREDDLLTFEELMEIHFIQMFRKEGVSFQTIRKASATASRLFETPYPFTVKKFYTDGKTVFATLLKNENEMVEDLEKGQYVFKTIIRPFFKKLEYRGADEKVIRFWPLEKKGRIVIDPQRKFGKPIDSTSGVSTMAIVDAVKAGGGQKPSVVALWLGIPLSAVRAAVKFESSLAS